MTITSEWEIGAHYGADSDLYEFGTGNYSGTNKTGGKTGANCYSLTAATTWAKKATTASLQKRIGGHWQLQAPASGTSTLFNLRDASNNILVGVRVKSGGDMALYIGASEQDTYTGAVLGAWRHIGLDVKIDAVAGWAVVYYDGTEIMRFEGNTGAANITNVYIFGGPDSPSTGMLLDDFYCDDTTSEAAAAAPPMRQFYEMTLSASGNYSNFDGSDGNKVNNYALVDELAPNGDTDYVYATSASVIDSYITTDYTIIAGMTVNAVWPFAIAKKTGTASTQAVPFLRENSTDWEGTAQNVASDYALVIERRTLCPDGTAWDQTGINGLEVGVKSEGGYA